MSPEQVIRAWKEGDGQSSRAAGDVPPHPVGAIDIADAALELAGAVDERTEYLETLGCCQGITQATKCDITAGYPICTVYCLTIVMTGSLLCPAT